MRCVVSAVAVAASFFVATGVNAAEGPERGPGKVVVADRSSGTLTVISARDDSVVATLDLPPDVNTPEPMYVWYTPIRNRFFVGDRANDRVVAYSARTLQPVASIPAGMGVFHMWGSSVANQLWVNNDIENTSTVINLRSMEVMATVPTPADLVALGGKPHDVILSPEGRFAYVSVIGVDGDFDYVVQYSTRTFEEIGRAAVGGDPHLSLHWRNRKLFVPCQETNEVYVLNRVTMETITVLDVPGAHGAAMSISGRYFYTTNISGEGNDAIWTIDTKRNMVVGEPTDAPYAVPHNIAIAPNGKMYVTHSGMNDKVSVYRVGLRHRPIPRFKGEVTVGMNPFGIAWVP